MPEPNWTIEEADSASLSPADLSAIRHLMDVAFGERFSEEDWRHALGGTHVFIRAVSYTHLTLPTNREV